MKRLKLIFKELDFLQLSVIIFSVSFAFGIAVNSIAFFILTFAGLVYTILGYRSKLLFITHNLLSYLFIAFFFMVLIRELIIDTTTAPKVAFSYIAFLLIPIIIIYQSRGRFNCIRIACIAFLIGMVTNALVNLSFGVYRGVIIREEGVNFWYFTYQFLAEPFGIQPIYLGYFYVIALLIVFHFKTLIRSKIVFYVVVVLLVLSVFLLAARNAILSLCIVLPLYLLLSKKLSLKKGIILVCILAICFASALQNPVVKNRILKVANKGNVYSGSSLRSNIWQSAISASKQNIVWGSGEEKAGLLLLDEFKSRDLKIPLKYKYHSHNQFLHTLVQYGMVGLILLIALVITSFWKSWNLKNYFGFCLALIFFFAMITEAIFTRQWGQFSYVFFMSLLLLIDDNQVSESS